MPRIGERYRRAADGFLGLDIEPSEVYEWGWTELRRIQGEMERVSQQIKPGATVLDFGFAQLEGEWVGDVDGYAELWAAPLAALRADLDDLADTLDLEIGGTYPLDFFFAERHSVESHFRIETSIADLVPVE